MARTKKGAELTAEHLQKQLAVRAKVVQDAVALFATWDPDVPATYVAFERAMVLLTQSSAASSAAIAAEYYRKFRDAELPDHPSVGLPVVLASPPSDVTVQASVAATARSAYVRALAAGQSREQALASALVQVSGSVARHALNSGRRTILEEIKRDDRALGWIRVSSGRPCAFCAMLMSRGPVYKEETVRFRAHDHCACGAEPVYEGSEWPAMNRDMHELWKRTGSLNGMRQELDRMERLPLDDRGRWVGPAKCVKVAPEDFVGFRERSAFPEMLSGLDAQWYRENGAQCYKLPGADAGYALFRDPGNDMKVTLISVHNNEATIHGLGRAIVDDAVQNGAQVLDCYAPYLPGFYRRCGFRETSRLPWADEYAPKDWDYVKFGRPDVVFMERGDEE